ncbi:MAG: ornithine carbamoyltransferase [Gammaproteobacteria bacterium AqS3]|nr:ornithine carbamoyltransferase [Gammaproteobacteria bacterium AqS3]
MARHFLNLADLSTGEIRALINRAAALRRDPLTDTLSGRTLALLFSKPSTRTRIALEAGMAQLGGQALYLGRDSLQLGRGESISDTARVMSSMVDAVAIRTHAHAEIAEFAAHSDAPVINALSERAHPCQLLADLMTWQERCGAADFDAPVAWIGDGNNVCNSWLEASSMFGFELRVACPEGFEPDAERLRAAGASIVRDVGEAVRGAAVVNTDTWVSMGDDPARAAAFAGYQVTAELLDQAAEGVILLHCLPAYRGSEVDETVLDDARSAVWQQAENRLHTHKALLELLLR